MQFIGKKLLRATLLMKIIEFNRNTKPKDVLDSAREYDFIFLIGYREDELHFHCTEDMTPDQIIGFLERMKMEAMTRF